MQAKILSLLLAIIPIMVNAQTGIKGTVSAAGSSVSFASVIIEKSIIGVSTNEDGTFILDDLKEGAYQVRASYIGYKSSA